MKRNITAKRPASKPERRGQPKRVTVLYPSGLGQDWDEAKRRVYKDWGTDLRKLAKHDD